MMNDAQLRYTYTNTASCKRRRSLALGDFVSREGGGQTVLTLREPEDNFADSFSV